ncbi:MAG: cation-translocating P-type ATPase [Cellulomonadaceae bacterium]
MANRTIAATPDPTTSPHASDPGAVVQALGTTEAGLSGQDAGRRWDETGPNELPKAPGRPAVLRFLAHFDDVLIYILIAAAVLKAMMGDWVDCAIIFAVAVINALIGFVQEGRAESALEGLKGMLSSSATVRRDGAWTSVDAREIVPGDIVRVRSGDRVPADVRVLQESNLRVEESALTGESLASAKQTEPVEADAGVGDRDSMLFSGTLVAAGQGTGVVTATGARTEIGKIQQMIEGVESMETPLTRQLARFGKVLSLGILAMAVVMLLIGRLVHDFPAAELISAAIGFAVAAIPEGLPALVTITLALGVQQMARRNAITRKLTSVETLGAVSTICSDKTGTLTKNEMTVRTVVTAGDEFTVSGTGYAPEGEIRHAGGVGRADDPVLEALVEVMAVCNDTDVVADGERWRLVGEPTEGALTTLARKAGFDTAPYERLAVVPFESAHKFMATLTRTPDGERAVQLKGAPDRVLERCDTQLTGAGVEPLDRAFWEDQIERLGAQGLRVLAAARTAAAPQRDALEPADVDSGLTLVGLAGIVDPPRPEAVTAIRECHTAGIRVKMITGDHAGTARAIAYEMGLVDSPDAPVLTGAELETMSQTELQRRAPGVDVYARTSPEHKIRIVRALQSRGETVAMTGDGVNDAPALRRADVGVAMGIKGTEATKDAADIVLADDNFATIERAVEEGRRIYDNVKKSVVFLLPTNGAQSLVVLVAVLLGWTLPLDPVQILWVNMVTAVTLSLALAYEPAEPGIMNRPPRNVGASIVDRRFVSQILVASVLIGGVTIAVFDVARGWGYTLAESQTAAVMTLALGQVAYLFNCRFLYTSSVRRGVFGSNRVIWLSLGSLLALQAVFVYVPWVNDLFHSAPLTWRGWVVPLLLAIGVFAVMEAWKALVRRVHD